nr:D-alanine--D-alanine ligase [uncultured bacterium]
MAKLKVGILFGGKSGEHEVSIVSALSIYQALDKSKYDPTLIGIDKTGRWLLPDQSRILAERQNARLIKLNKEHQTVSLLPFDTDKNLVPVVEDAVPTAQRGLHFDVILPILHGTYGEDGTVQGLLELANLPYIGSGVLGSAVSMDKETAKRLLRDAGIPVVPFMTVHRNDFKKQAANILAEAKRRFGLPYFVKPANMGSSVGVNKVKTEAEALAKFEDALLYDTKVLVEQAIDARELEVSVLGNHDPQASIVGEIIPNHEFYTYEAKYLDENGADLAIPARDLSAATTKRVQEVAIAGFRALECAGLARVDFFLDRKTSEIYLNEVNTIPGFTQISMYPKLWAASGLPYPQLLDRLIELALERHREKNSLKTTYEPK